MTSLSKEQERLFRRLHSAAGIFPVGAFFLAHVWINARALQGERALSAVATRLSGFPAMLAVEALFVWAPLAFHAGYGVRMLLRERPREARGPLDNPWASRLQRVTGAVTLIFLALHLYQFRLQVALGKLAPEDLFPHLCDALSTTTSAGIPLNAALYLAGVAAASYHFANGLLGFLHTFAWAQGAEAPSIARQRQVRIVGACCAGVGLATFLVAGSTVIYLATGATWPVPSDPAPPDDGVGTIRIGAGTPE
jgi:succinate dehydrogenase/fumarate reductase cytochrome b subunit (b558 family)